MTHDDLDQITKGNGWIDVCHLSPAISRKMENTTSKYFKGPHVHLKTEGRLNCACVYVLHSFCRSRGLFPMDLKHQTLMISENRVSKIHWSIMVNHGKIEQRPKGVIQYVCGMGLLTRGLTRGLTRLQF